VNARLEELRRRADAIAGELADIREEIVRVEQGRFVQVNFIGHPKLYTYEMAPGHEAEIGDYVCVHSPMTRRDELVKVIHKGKGPTLYGRAPKIARQVIVRVRPQVGISEPSPVESDDWDPFRNDESIC